jgi:hemerythrin
MAHIKWRKKFSVGVAAFDDDHKIIINLINRLDDVARHGADDRALQNAFTLLLGYAEDHFRREEEMMERFGYPGLQSHREDHEILREDVLRLHGRLAAGHPRAEVYRDLCDLLETWLNHHILLVDMAYKEYFTAIACLDMTNNDGEPCLQ